MSTSIKGIYSTRYTVKVRVHGLVTRMPVYFVGRSRVVDHMISNDVPDPGVGWSLNFGQGRC